MYAVNMLVVTKETLFETSYSLRHLCWHVPLMFWHCWFGDYRGLHGVT